MQMKIYMYTYMIVLPSTVYIVNDFEYFVMKLNQSTSYVCMKCNLFNIRFMYEKRNVFH